MDAITFILVLVGAFYALAGYVATRAALTGHFVDRAIAALGGEAPSPADTAQTFWMLGAATLVLAGGVALLFLLDLAVGLFLVSAAGQALYIFHVAPRYFDAADSFDAQGRRQTTNAFVVYLAATAFVTWATWTEKLTRWQDADGRALTLCAALVAGHIGFIAWTLLRAPAAGPGFASYGGSSHNDDWADDGLSETGVGRDRAHCTRIKVMADYHCYPLWALDEDLYGDFPPEALDLSPDLIVDLNAWADAFTESLDPDDPGASLWSEDERRAHDAQGRALAVRLARELPERMIYVLEADIGVVQVHADDPSSQAPSSAGI